MVHFRQTRTYRLCFLKAFFIKKIFLNVGETIVPDEIPYLLHYALTDKYVSFNITQTMTFML